MDLRTRLESHTVKSLKAEIRKVKATFNYGKLKRAELIDLMVKNKDKFNHIQHADSKKTEPKKAEPKKAEPKKVKKIIKKPEPKKAEPKKAEPKKVKKLNNYEKLIILFESEGNEKEKKEAVKDLYADGDVVDELQFIFENNPRFIVESGSRKGLLQSRYLNSSVATLLLLKEVKKYSDVRRVINNADIPILNQQEKKEEPKKSRT